MFAFASLLALVGVAPDLGAVKSRLADDANEYTFAVYGDTRNGGEVERALVDRILADKPSVAFHTGDVVTRGDDEDSWRSFFANEEKLLASVPVLFAPGNHEIYGDVSGAAFDRYLRPAGETNHYYSRRFGSMRMIVLDGNHPDDPKQTAWLERALAQARGESGVRHIFVMLHQPPFSIGSHCGAASEQAEWLALYERYGVRAVFGGHDHGYGRFRYHGRSYFVSGGGGAPLYAERRDCPRHDLEARQVYVPANHYLRARVRGAEVELSSIGVDGALLDRVTLREEAWAPALASVAGAGAAQDLFDRPTRAGKEKLMWGGAGFVALVAGAAYVTRRSRRRGDRGSPS